jgi:hypothetical protein
VGLISLKLVNPSSEMFPVEPDVDLANEAPEMDMQLGWE